MNGILISFVVKTFLDSDRKLLEMFTVKLKTFNEVIKKYMMKSSMELQYNLQNNYSILLEELIYPNLLTLSKDLLQQIIEKTNYTNCVLIFSTDESNQLLCIASSDVLFTGQLKIDVEKSLLENNSHLFNDSTIQELGQVKINIDLRTLAIDSIDSIIKSINQLDLNVYLIHLFFHNNDPNHLTLIEFHKLNNDQRFSKYEKYLLSNYITDFLMVIMPQISDNEIAQLIDHKIHSLTQIHPNFNEISFLSRSVNDRDSTVATMIMFNNLGFIKQWNICQSKLACFILTIKNNYRQPTYHNWTHAFTVGHMAYIILTIERTLIHQYLDEMEQLALFIGALCHDIDHRGFNNHYQTLIHSPLDAVYGYKGSILEHHHIDQTMRILNMKDCNIFSQMTKIDIIEYFTKISIHSLYY
ncbi:unnamed protein product [Schistosoma margrebowiei]|uniref:PDEase domain-containing protein n=1 Tax=Schistosoma margrebowiei TaxID=48269 RepID=A0AA85AFN9_9TREM|nr:unnamed protein product [Schistosoma margrebowiei]